MCGKQNKQPERTFVMETKNNRETIVNLSFRWPGEPPENRLILFKTPETITAKMIQDELLSENERYADFSGENNIYAENGRNAQTLADHVCKKNGWSWTDVRPEIHVTLY